MTSKEIILNFNQANTLCDNLINHILNDFKSETILQTKNVEYFKNNFQKVGCALNYEDYDLIFINGQTSIGKSLCFLGPIVLEINKTSIIILPTNALIYQFSEKLKVANISNLILNSIEKKQEIEEAIKYGMTDPNNFAYDNNVIITTPEYFSKDNIQSLIEILSKNNIISRIVIDECHIPIQRDESFRDEYLKIYNKLSLITNCKKVVLSATINKLIKQFIISEIKPNAYAVIKMTTYQRKIFIFNISNEDLITNCLVEDSIKRLSIVKKCSNDNVSFKGIIIIRRLSDISYYKEMYEKNGYTCVEFTSNIGEEKKKENLKMFNNNEFNFLITTSGTLVGIDTVACNMIIMHALSITSTNFIQDLGRLSRAGNCSWGLFTQQQIYSDRINVY
uniref:ATP-dependent RNA helicase n=1 Tax=Strongyloides stercoralis TaxID=6248 RepID=A0A0K0EAY2_STRER